MVRTILSFRALFRKLSCIFCAGFSITAPKKPFRASKAVTNGDSIVPYSPVGREHHDGLARWTPSGCPGLIVVAFGRDARGGGVREQTGKLLTAQGTGRRRILFVSSG